MHDNITKIKQEPPRIYSAFTMARQNTLPFQYMPNFIANSLNLPIGITTAYHKIIGKATYPSGIQQQNITSLLITGGFNCFAGYFYRFQSCPPKLYNNPLVLKSVAQANFHSDTNQPSSVKNSLLLYERKGATISRIYNAQAELIKTYQGD